MSEPFSVNIKGRGHPSAVGRQNDDGSVTVRIDDDVNPSFWLEVTLPAGQVRHLAARLPRLHQEQANAHHS